jgi:TnpA family transposase
LRAGSSHKLQAAITIAIEGNNRFNLPKYWGTGDRASVDGTKWDIYENNLLAEYHIRYGGYGGIAYYNHLVANCLIFYNVFEISRILNELRQEGYPLNADAVAAFSPYC